MRSVSGKCWSQVPIYHLVQPTTLKMAAAILKLLLIVSLFRNLSTVHQWNDTINHLPVNSWKRPRSSSLPCALPRGNMTLFVSCLLLAGDVSPNPGPKRQASVYPCGLCDLPVTWDCQGVCCDDCDIWHHKSCLEL